MKNFVKVNGIWREYNPETNEIVGESGYFDISNFETMQAESVHDLDWNGTVVLKNLEQVGLILKVSFLVVSLGVINCKHKLYIEVMNGNLKKVVG